MRKYLITYWAERNDEATDFEVEIEADNIEKALEEFKKMRISYKIIESIVRVWNV